LLFDLSTVGSEDDPDEKERRERQLTDAVLAYLREHPQAMDSLEGIAEWWIDRAQIRTDVTLLAMVLDQLTQEGRLEELGSGDQRLYRLRSGRRR
jgi:hypothetical protein